MNTPSYFYFIIGLILVIIAGLGGYFIGFSKPGAAPSSQQIAQKATQAAENSPIIKQQTATIQGKITSISDNAITVINDQNQSDQFSLSNKLVVYKPINTSQAGASTDVKDIKTDTLAFIILELVDGKYQVVSISYPPDAASLPTPPAIPSSGE